MSSAKTLAGVGGSGDRLDCRVDDPAPHPQYPEVHRFFLRGFFLRGQTAQQRPRRLAAVGVHEISELSADNAFRRASAEQPTDGGVGEFDAPSAAQTDQIRQGADEPLGPIPGGIDRWLGAAGGLQSRFVFYCSDRPKRALLPRTNTSQHEVNTQTSQTYLDDQQIGAIANW